MLCNSQCFFCRRFSENFAETALIRRFSYEIPPFYKGLPFEKEKQVFLLLFPHLIVFLTALEDRLYTDIFYVLEQIIAEKIGCQYFFVPLCVYIIGNLKVNLYICRQ